MLLPLILCAAGAVSDPTPRLATAPAPAPSVFATYDLAALAPPTNPSDFAESLLPMLRAHRGELGYEAPRPEPQDAETLVELWRGLHVGEFEYEGRRLEYDEYDRRLRVTAPAALQEATARYFALLEGTLGASTELAIDVWSPPASARDDLPSGLVAASDLAKRLEGVPASARRSYRLGLRSGATAGLDLTRATRLVVDFNAEIAQGATVYDPIVEDVLVGTRLFARGAPSQAGMWLALVLVDGEALGEPASRDLRFENYVATQDRAGTVPGPGAVQTVETLGRAFALNTFLPEGQALVVASSHLVGAESRARVIAVRRSGPALPVFRRASDLVPGGARDAGAAGDASATSGGARFELLVVDAGSAAPPSCGVHSTIFGVSSLGNAWSRVVRGEQDAVFASFRGGTGDGPDRVSDVLRGDDPSFVVERAGNWLLARGADPATVPTRPVDDALVALGRWTPEAHVVQVTLALRRAGDPAAVLARTTVAVRAGVESALVLARQGFEVEDYDVEVAQLAAVSDPQLYETFEGLAARVEPRRTSGGDLVLDLDVRARWQVGETRTFDPGSDQIGTMRHATHDQIATRERLVFPRDATGPRRARIGEGGGTGGGLALEVEVRELR